MRIVYCGFDFFSECLKSLLSLEHEILEVRSFEADNYHVYNDYMEAICRNCDIPFSLNRINEGEIASFRAAGCDLLITAGYLHKIPPLEPGGIRGINVHPSLLPLGRGRWPLHETILRNLPESGVSIHKITQQLDAGDILLQQHFTLDPWENLESLSAKYQMKAKRAIEVLMGDFDVYWEQAKPQTGKAEYWPLPADSLRSIDWNDSAEQISRRSRAFGKYGCKAFFNDQWWTVFELTAWKEVHEIKPGETAHLTNTETIVACNDGYVCLRYFRAAE